MMKCHNLVHFALIMLLLVGITSGNDVPSTYEDNLLSEAKSSYTQGDITSSLKLVDEYLLKYPSNASAWNLKGLIYLQNGSYILAEESFSKALNFTSDDKILYYNLGLAAFNNIELVKAQEYFNKSISEGYNNSDLYFHLGLTQYALSQDRAAIISFQKSVELSPNVPATWVNLGVTYERTQQINPALLAYTEATKIDPTYALSWYLMGKLYYSEANYTLGTEAFHEYINLSPNDVSGWLYYAMSLKQIGQKEEALSALNRAVELDPTYQVLIPYYDNESYVGKIYENVVTRSPPLSVIYIFFAVMILFSLIAFIRK